MRTAFTMLAILFVGSHTAAQDNEAPADTSKGKVAIQASDSTILVKDSIPSAEEDISPLDIGSDRGIFILSGDRLLQLRILGSIRAAINYSDQLMEDKQTFNPYEIITGDVTRAPNYYMGLEQTRFGIEVTRRTRKRGDIFIRLEGDFKTSNKSLRIRHAYGQVGNFLVGQTWSLMNNISYQPALVSLDGPATGSGIRTPQVRYTRSGAKRTSWSAALEYSRPSFDIPDSLQLSVVQVIPDFTGRFTYASDLVNFRVSGIVTNIAGRNELNKSDNIWGYGFSIAMRLRFFDNGTFFLSGGGGSATSHYFDIFDGRMEDLVYNPISNKFEALFSAGGYIAYEHQFPNDISTSITFGVASIDNKDFQIDSEFSHGYNTMLNVFWKPSSGSSIGVEYAFGQRFDKAPVDGYANRLSMLVYYDF